MSQPVTAIDAATLPDRAAFEAAVVAPCRPLVLRRAVADWPILEAAASGRAALIDALLPLAAPGPAELFVGPSEIAGRYFYAADLDGFNFERRSMPLPDAIAAIGAATGEHSLYLGSIPAEIGYPAFAATHAMPWLREGVGPRLWLGTASTVACHHDRLDNLAVCVAGRRRFTLFPPEAIGDLYVGPIDHTMAGQPVSLAVGSAPGGRQWPRFEAWREQALVADLEPGDALYLPKLWWHQVEATGDLNLLVNYWWDAHPAGPDDPFTAMLLAMTTLAERPLPERTAWRAFFDHYVFRPDRHPLEHLSPERHGILGPLDANRGRIRAMVMQWLRR
ncbi:transcriptional regulator [Sphingomonas spermidinifaciens]|uniref:Transcriptional regulator n=1 Tax=Sphingomonas spermidinifaciens TaxID=1141889 RepID=A0A2A4B1I8_9SPHN|nr:cupin-like domain-containing protein [Sphingomonas spermidinifaciens]PCD02311.1 transcriptional regulator [Sphingomonas spermidinifaciens]